MTFKNCRALKTIVSSLLIAQLALAIPAARAQEAGTLGNDDDDAPAGTLRVIPNTEAPKANEPPAAKPHAQPPASGNAKATGNAITKPYCEGLANMDDDVKKVKEWLALTKQNQNSHMTMAVKGQMPELVKGQDEFAKEASQKLGKRAESMCEYRRVMLKRIDSAEQRLKTTSEAAAGVEACTREKELHDFIWELNAYHRTYMGIVEKVRNGERSRDGKTQTSKGLVQFFFEGSRQNAGQIAKANSMISGSSVALLPINSKPLATEFAESWGPNAEKQSGQELQKPLGTGAVFANIMDGLYYEKESAEKTAKKIQTLGAELKSGHPGCNLSDPTIPGVKKYDGRSPVDSSSARVKNLPKSDNGDVTAADTRPSRDPTGDRIKELRKVPPGGETPEERKERTRELDELTAERAAAKADADKYQANVDRRDSAALAPTGPRTQVSGSDREGRDNTTTRERLAKLPGESDAPPKDLEMPKNTNNDSTASNFLSNNAGLLVGGALVVGGGTAYYFWDKNEKKKKQDEWDAYWLSVQPKTGTTTSSSVDTSHRLMNRTAISNAIVGMTLPGLQVAIVDANGNTLSGQDTDITISCVNPIPCSLTGTTIVRSVNGVATFTDLRFLSPHVGVRLRYSTTWGGIEQSNGFDVTSGAATATSTSTAIRQ
jgi:hypothetical protein